jgi:hypothetical protein
VWLGLGLVLFTMLAIAAFSGTGQINLDGTLKVLQISKGTCTVDSANLNVNCDVGTLGSGETATVLLEFTPSHGGTC